MERPHSPAGVTACWTKPPRRSRSGLRTATLSNASAGVKCCFPETLSRLPIFRLRRSRFLRYSSLLARSVFGGSIGASPAVGEAWRVENDGGGIEANDPGRGGRGRDRAHDSGPAGGSGFLDRGLSRRGRGDPAGCGHLRRPGLAGRHDAGYTKSPAAKATSIRHLL
jgi:hypothetical protein